MQVPHCTRELSWTQARGKPIVAHGTPQAQDHRSAPWQKPCPRSCMAWESNHLAQMGSG